MKKTYIKNLIGGLLVDHKKISMLLEEIQSAAQDGTVTRKQVAGLSRTLTDLFLKEDTELYPILVRVQNVEQEKSISLFESKRQVESREKGLSEFIFQDDLGIQADLIAFAKSTLVIFKGLSECSTFLTHRELPAFQAKWREVYLVIEERLSYEETFLFPMVLDAIDQLGLT